MMHDGMTEMPDAAIFALVILLGPCVLGAVLAVIFHFLDREGIRIGRDRVRADLARLVEHQRLVGPVIRRASVLPDTDFVAPMPPVRPPAPDVEGDPIQAVSKPSYGEKLLGAFGLGCFIASGLIAAKLVGFWP